MLYGIYQNKKLNPPEEIMNSAIQFQTLIQSISTNYNSDFIINTDQTSCEYRANVSRTCIHTDEKIIELGKFHKRFE